MWKATKNVPVDALSTDGLQARFEINKDVIETYTELVKEGAVFPPVMVFWDQASDHYYLADGFHRLAAYTAAGHRTIPADVQPGTFRDALKYSLSANSTHGLTRTNADKRRAVSLALQDAEFVQLSDRQIAKLCGTTHPFVAKVRGEMGMKSSEGNVDLTDKQMLASASQLGSNELNLLYVISVRPRYGSNGKLERRRFAVTLDGQLTITKQGRRVVEMHAADDPFLTLELEIASGFAGNYFDMGSLRPALESLYRAAKWLYRNTFSYNQNHWLPGLVERGYLQQYNPEGQGAELYFHITPAGCALLGKPELPIAPTPSVAETRAPASISNLPKLTPQEKHERAVDNRQRQIQITRDNTLRQLTFPDWASEGFLMVFPPAELQAIETALAAIRQRVEAAMPLPMETVTTSDQEGAA